MATLTVQAFRNAPSSSATFADVANEMIAIAQSDRDEYPSYDTFIKNQFELREVLGPIAVDGPQAVGGFAPSRAACCGTMQNLEYDEA